MVIDKDFNQFISNFITGNKKLKSINLSMTTIDENQILEIIKKCPNLEIFNIKDCQYAPRGWSHMVKKEEFPQLIKLLAVKITSKKT